MPLILGNLIWKIVLQPALKDLRSQVSKIILSINIKLLITIKDSIRFRNHDLFLFDL